MRDENLKPNESEEAFLHLAYNRFIDLFKEIESDGFWDQPAAARFSRIKDIFAVYAELINYEPISNVLKEIAERRIVENELGKELFQTIRNLIAHFPFFDAWDDVAFTQRLITWEGRSRTIDRFFTKFEGREQIKYRFWDSRTKEMTYVDITFPANYTRNQHIYLRNIIEEKPGVRFSIRLMLQILLENVADPGEIISELNA